MRKCYTFDSKELGSFGWPSSPAEIVSLTEFELLLKEHFSLKFTAPELGALVNYCYPIGTSSNVMNCDIFKSTFLQIKSSTEKFKGDEREGVLLAEYVAQLKSSYLSRLNGTKGVVETKNAAQLKPWQL